MRFRLGYVAMTLNLENCSPSGTVTVAAFNRLPDEEARMYRLRRITRDNLKNTYRILLYNQAMNIKVYRFTSKLIPLATHPLAEHWDYAGDFAGEFKQIGDFVKENGFRVSAHPDHYTLINSPTAEVLQASLKDLDYHVRLFEAMGLEDYRYKLVLHVGGLYGDKKSSMERFKENFVKLPDRIRKRIMLENDDKSYTASDVLSLCNALRIPMVMDIHHHHCVNNGERLADILPEVFATWKDDYFTPKVHFSSPKSQKDFRSHAGDIDPEEFKVFLQAAEDVGRDFDVMLEAKNKDAALLKLSGELRNMDGIETVNKAEFTLFSNHKP